MKTKFNYWRQLYRILQDLTKIRLTFALRLRVLCGSIVALFGIAFIYLSYLVMVGMFNSSEGATALANKNLQLKHDIVDRNNNVLAVTIPSSSLYLRPKNILDKNLAINSISTVFNISKETATNMVNSNAAFVWVARNISNKQLNDFLKYGVVGVYIEKGYRRFYPYGNYCSHVVGITNIDGKGVSGMEYYFHDTLFKNVVQVSLDIRMQVILREALMQAVERNQAKRAFGIIVDPNNGEVLALSTVPDFDPNNRDKLLVQDMFNYTTQAVFEQGSTFKLFTIAMALDSDNVTMDQVFDVSKPIVKNGYVLVDDTYIDRSISIPEILIYSSDVGSSLIAKDFDAEIQKKYFSYMGLFNATTLEIPEKSYSVLPKNWNELTRMTLSYGYGLAVSQATAANAFLTLINGGYYVPLTLLKLPPEPKLEKYQVFKPTTSQHMRMMGRLVMAQGTGRAADVEGLSVGGKTGTAELLDLKTGRYNMHKVLATVLAYFPAHKPQYLIMMSVEEPQRVKGNSWSRVAARTIAPEVKKVISDIGALLAMPPSHDGATSIDKNDQQQILNFVTNGIL